MAELLSDFNWADYLPWVWEARKEAEARLQAELVKQAAQQMAVPLYGSGAGDESSAPFFLGSLCDGRVSTITCFAPIVKLPRARWSDVSLKLSFSESISETR